ncbi:toxin-antitoxin system YwqK family antitoxin [Flavobacterium sp.]|uniref:toxin-antitoxin system YwqK family antitoxin n=1 Tax=Flavobacterium sp. TaxID=239 RepID=UPI003D6C6C36
MNDENVTLRPFINKLITLKTKALSSFLYLIVVLLLTSFSDPYSIKRISDANFRYEFYTTDKTVKPHSDKVYYWFKGGLIHNAQAGIGGALLNDAFVKMYHSNQLAEQGVFKKGLKVGLWKTWYPNGVVETTQKWSSGLRSGEFYHYDENGSVLEKGSFKNNRKNGTWVDFTKKDTVVYKKGIVFVKKPKLSKEEKAKLKEEEKKADEAKKTLKAEEKAKKATPIKSEKESGNKPKKEGFFKKLFHKKKANQNVNG